MRCSDKVLNLQAWDFFDTTGKSKRRSNPLGPHVVMDCFANPVIRRRFAAAGWIAMTVGLSEN